MTQFRTARRYARHGPARRHPETLPGLGAVLVPLDGSVAARSALPVANGLARALGATLHVLHVSQPELAPAEAAARLHPGAPVVHTAAGSPAAAILRGARRGAMVVMTPHCGHPRATGLGSVAEAVLRGCPTPVVLVPPGRGEVPWSPRRLLLPLDGSPGSTTAVHYALHLATASGAEIGLLHAVAACCPPPCDAGGYGMSRYADQPQHEWPAWRREFSERAAPGRGEEPLHVQTVTGPAGDATVRAAAAGAADLIVAAWHGVLDEGHAATLQRLIRDAPCPVMVVRAG